MEFKIRKEFKELQPVIHDLDEILIYSDKNLIAGVKKSMKEAKQGKGKILKSEKEMDKFFDEL